jgi:hypothetical protein
MRTRELERLLVAVEQQAARNKDVLGTLISWMSQSANSPIRRDEAMELLKKLERSQKG